MDGAYFGTTFAHLLLMSYPALRPSSRRPSPEYIPRVFGFKVHSDPPAKSIAALEEGYNKERPAVTADAKPVARSVQQDGIVPSAQ